MGQTGTMESGDPVESGDTAPEDAPVLFTVESTPDKGKGVFAARLLTKGTCIISEAPLFKVRNDFIEFTKAQQKIADKVRQLPKDQQRAFLSLHNQCPERGVFAGIVKTNMLALNDSGKGGLFLQSARLNNSCVPNAYHEYNVNLGRMTVYATRDIPQGEEITIIYVWDTGPVRRKLLRENYGFNCVCTHCRLPAAQRDAIDARMNEIYSIYDVAVDRDYALFDPVGTLHLIHRIWILLNSDGITDIRVARIFINAADLTALNGDAARSSFFACRAYNALKICIGEDGVGVQEMEPRITDPKLSHLFGTTNRWASEVGDIPRSGSVQEFQKWLWKLDEQTRDVD
ncbi:MAG: hypothetical protein M1812_001252 [Candelaria pacifica]|nr:MAG: hypothetical protein M1812_001252 [Candelaria pacifica]